MTTNDQDKPKSASASLLSKKIAEGTIPTKGNPDGGKILPITPLRRLAVAGLRGEEVTLPILGRIYFELPGSREWQEIEAAVHREMKRLDFDDLRISANAIHHQTELALRVLAASAKDPNNHDQPFATLDEWGELDNDLVSIAWLAFGDVRERLDPVEFALTTDDMFAIQAAVKKKDKELLRSFGLKKLSLFAASMDDPPPTSPPPSSLRSESSSEP